MNDAARLEALEAAVFGRSRLKEVARIVHAVNERDCRAPFLSWSDLAEIERVLMLAPYTNETSAALFHIREELDRGEKAGVFSATDRGAPHPSVLRRYDPKKPKLGVRSR